MYVRLYESAIAERNTQAWRNEAPAPAAANFFQLLLRWLGLTRD